MGGIWQLIKAKPSKGYILSDRTRKVEFNHMYFVSAHIHPSEGGGFILPLRRIRGLKTGDLRGKPFVQAASHPDADTEQASALCQKGSPRL